MERSVTGAGSLLLRGLGPSGLLISRGLGTGSDATIVITVPSQERPRQLRRRGSGPKEERKQDDIRCYFVNARLISVNDEDLAQPIEGEVKVTYGIDRFKVTSTLPSVSKRITRLAIRVRLID